MNFYINFKSLMQCLAIFERMRITTDDNVILFTRAGHEVRVVGRDVPDPTDHLELEERLLKEACVRHVATQTDEDAPQKLRNIGRGATPVVLTDTVLPPRGRGRCVAACKAASEAFHRVMDA